MKFAVIQFPGSNCDQDCLRSLRDDLGIAAEYVWHKTTSLEGCDAVVLPGGFSYGDYLRCGAMAKFSPIMKSVREFAAAGGLVIGVCNGFQVLCETGLLPGALIRNRDLHFVCEQATLRVETSESPFTSRCRTGELLRIPIAHGEGSYFADAATLRDLETSPADPAALRGRRDRRADAGIQSERLGFQHRRHLQLRAQRLRPHAAPRSR